MSRVNLRRKQVLVSFALPTIIVAFAFSGIAVTAHADTVRITVSHYSDATGPYFNKMAHEFEKATPGTTIKIEEVNWDALQQKLQTDIMGGANSDLAIVATRWLLDFVHDDVAEPLDGYMDASFRDRFIGQILAPGEIKGKVCGLPLAASTRALYYNKDLLAKAGYPNGPKTWNDVIDASKKLKAMHIAGFGLQGKEIETDVYFYYGLWSYGGDVIGKDGKAAFNSQAGVKAATLYKTMIDDGLTEPGVTGYNREGVQNLFKQGRVAMVISLPFLSKQIAKEVPNLKYGIGPIPMGTTQATYAVTDSIMMFKNSKVKKSAWKFLDFLFTKSPRVEFSKTEGFLPTTKAEASDPALNGPDTKAFIALLPNARFAPTVTGWEYTAKVVSDAMQSVYLGKAQPAAALNAAAEKANRSLGK
ncbi:carbohydrate ABC transporter substrate-binding protein, CUT1 family [Paraburkholderia tuberum]|uniref:Carbohydrate ABC transporter substrate-binding protein, CUT1 family n=3 Tax=Paraburkholderia tuberum TaxID=157910 RepID=A0A1H1J945_9BURK|nr:sugar ABC transporter substrate-binding protein [Paraburkholderia tuberum]SDR46146.1 carbohydrate ABC transporter substrate-binding protein, CUT1 family [Paraburkholderia tuberum]